MSGERRALSSNSDASEDIVLNPINTGLSQDKTNEIIGQTWRGDLDPALLDESVSIRAKQYVEDFGRRWNGTDGNDGLGGQVARLLNSDDPDAQQYKAQVLAMLTELGQYYSLPNDAV